MQMRLKFAEGVQPTQNQAREIANSIMSEPDMGWEVDSRFEPLAKEGKHTYEVELEGEFGQYHYRVNLLRELITILNIED